MSSRQMDNIKTLSKRLGFLQIINEVLEEMNKWSDKKMSVAPIPATINNNKQAVMPKNMVLDLG